MNIPITPATADALRIQWQRFVTPEAEEAWVHRFSGALEPALLSALDWDLRPPTNAQVDHAVTIAKTLKTHIPSDALLFSGPMLEFLGLHWPEFNRTRGES